MKEAKAKDDEKRVMWFGAAARVLVFVLTAPIFTSCASTQRGDYPGGMSREDDKALQFEVGKDAAQLKERLGLSINQEFEVRTVLEGVYRKVKAMASEWQATRRIDLAKSREEIARIQRITEEQMKMTLTPEQTGLYMASGEARADHLLEYAINSVLQSSPPGGMSGWQHDSRMGGPPGGGTGGMGGFPGMGGSPGMGRGGW